MIGSALIVFSGVSIGAAAEHHHRTHHHASLVFRDSNAYAEPVYGPAAQLEWRRDGDGVLFTAAQHRRGRDSTGFLTP